MPIDWAKAHCSVCPIAPSLIRHGGLGLQTATTLVFINPGNNAGVRHNLIKWTLVQLLQ